VTLAAAAVLPHPPLLLEELGGAADPLADLRASCGRTVDDLLRLDMDRLVVLGAGDEDATYPNGSSGSAARYGVDVPVTLGQPAAGLASAELPLPLLVAGRLLAGRTAADGMIVSRNRSPAACAEVGRSLAAAGRTAFLVMGDGSARRDVSAPGYLDERAVPFDVAVAAALGAADTAALTAIDPELSDDLLVTGRPAWQALAGAADAADRRWCAELRYDAAPFGVGYLVALWT
jgi:hypothetical protein